MPAGAVFHPSCSRGLRGAIALLRKQPAPAGGEARGTDHALQFHSHDGLERRLQPAPAARERSGRLPAHHFHGIHGLERRLQPAPAAREPRRSAPLWLTPQGPNAPHGMTETPSFRRYP